MIKTVKKIFYL